MTQENITQSTPTTPTPTIAKTVSPPAKPPRSEPKPQQDEWETKLFGGSKPKGISLYFELTFIVLLLIVIGGLRPGSNESLNRRSWDSSKLASQIVEENEVGENLTKCDDNISVKSTPEVAKKEEKDGMFSKLRSNFRKGWSFRCCQKIT